MNKPQIRRPSTGTVLGGLALIVAVAGNANAFSADKVIVRKGDIAKGAVTARALAKGAVRSRAIAKGAVGPRALAKAAVGPAALKPGAVTAAALGSDAVTASALSPGSVYGGALGSVDTHREPIVDLDKTEAPGSWTLSAPTTAACSPGEELLGGGVAVTAPGSGEVAIANSLPVSNATSGGVVGQITSNAAGKAAAEVEAICLK